MIAVVKITAKHQFTKKKHGEHEYVIKESVREIRQQIDDKLQYVIPSPSKCIKAIKSHDSSGLLEVELEIDIDVWVECIKKQMDFDVERRLKEKPEVTCERIETL